MPFEKPYAEASAAAANCPRSFEPSEAGSERAGPSKPSEAPGHTKAAPPGAVALGSGVTEQCARGRSWPPRGHPGPQGLPMVRTHLHTEQHHSGKLRLLILHHV